MVDWMVQVFRVMRVSTPHTFFLAINFMDHYFESMQKSKISLPRSELHLIGLTCLFMSSKMEDVIPMHMD
jgi:hypothetical protein